MRVGSEKISSNGEHEGKHNADYRAGIYLGYNEQTVHQARQLPAKTVRRWQAARDGGAQKPAADSAHGVRCHC
jgi:hypothetical protein